jgi:hypothetical protein
LKQTKAQDSRLQGKHRRGEWEAKKAGGDDNTMLQVYIMGLLVCAGLALAAMCLGTMLPYDQHPSKLLECCLHVWRYIYVA